MTNNDNKRFQHIPNKMSCRAMEALELAGVSNQSVKKSIKKLIYYTHDDIMKALEGEKNGRINNTTSI